jgi:hypothetical protein
MKAPRSDFFNKVLQLLNKHTEKRQIEKSVKFGCRAAYGAGSITISATFKSELQRLSEIVNPARS